LHDNSPLEYNWDIIFELLHQIGAQKEAHMPGQNNALLVIDIQNDFCPSGRLAVAGGDEIINEINELMAQFGLVILTQDWHPPDHQSFASQHIAAKPFDVIQMPYGPQVLWPDHCVMGTQGAEFHESLHTAKSHLIIRKGFRRAIDSYSAFFENDKKTPTGLEGYLHNRGITELTIVGLATDYCVRYSAEDAARLGLNVSVKLDLCRAIDTNDSLAQALDSMTGLGVKLCW
jgi:nicotinamidase/pyrazinamidase